MPSILLGTTLRLAGAVGATTLAVLAHQAQSRRSHSMAAFLPLDLDAVWPVPSMGRTAFLDSVGVVLLLFAGCDPDASGWTLPKRPLSLAEREERIRPTWKGGGLDYSLDSMPASPDGPSSPLRLHNLASGHWAPGAGSTMASLVAALEARGLRPSHFDGVRPVVREMLSWQLPAHGSGFPLPEPSSRDALLVFSFDATPRCHSVEDCREASHCFRPTLRPVSDTAPVSARSPVLRTSSSPRRCGMRMRPLLWPWPIAGCAHAAPPAARGRCLTGTAAPDAHRRGVWPRREAEAGADESALTGLA